MLWPPIAVMLAAWALFGGVVATTARRAWRGAGEAPVEADAIVVFGAAVRDGRPSAELRARLEHALALYRAGWAPLIVCSGGSEEVDAMCRALAGRVPAGAVAGDRAGVSTRATIAGARDRGRVLLVSSGYHAHRIRAEARRRRLDARVCPAPGCPLDAALAARCRQVAREVVAHWWYAVRPA